jgi:uncharacterized protein (TIGR03435 family)
MSLCNKLVSTALFAVVSTIASGQPAAPKQNAAPAFAYEVVTIKPDNSGNQFWNTTRDGVSVSGMPPVGLIRWAYGLVSDDQLIGLPGWARSEPFAIQAKMDAETVVALEKLPPKERWNQMQQMMQGLLAERFAMKVHHETRELPVYELTVAKGGSKMKESPAGAAGNAAFSSGKISAHAISMANLVMNLAGTVGRVVVDKTGLEGTYDFTLEWAPDGADASDQRPSLFTAFEEQLGLKLVPAKGPVDVIAIDHMERPSEN